MIKIVRISSGDVIIGDCEAENKALKIKNPVFIVPTEKGFVFVDMLNWFSDDKEVTISDSQILYQLNPASELLDNYSQKISGIALPSKSIIGV